MLRLAARAAFHSGDMERALPLLQRALELVDADADPERAALVVEQRARTLRGLGEDGASVAALRGGARRACPRSHPAWPAPPCWPRWPTR